MKLKVQAQHLQPGDIVGSGEKVTGVIANSIKFPSSKCLISLERKIPNEANYEFKDFTHRSVLWGKYTMINVERNEK